MPQVHVIEHTRSISIPTECYSDLPAEVILARLTAFGDVSTAALLKEFIHRLSILQDKSKSDLQVEIDIGCVAVLVFELFRFVYFHFALWCHLSYVSGSVAQLEELRAECDKELNNARLMGDPLPSPSSCKL
jgi:hypothetical protein